MRHLTLAGLLGLVATAASAERFAYDCDFTNRCTEAGCLPQAASYLFRFDTELGSGELVADGTSFPGSHAQSDGMTHFILVNDFGAELVTITEGGGAYYTGHMAFEGQPGFYRLEGRCTRHAK